MARKNKGTFGKGKSQVPETDEFISGAERFFDKIRPHAGRLALAVVVAGAISVGVFGYRWWQNEKATNATEVYVETVSILGQPLATDLVPKDEKTHGSSKARAGSALTVVERIGGEYDGTTVATHAPLLRAAVLFKVGKFSEAAALYKEYNGPPSIAVFAKQGLGYALEAAALEKKEASEKDAGLRLALTAFEEMQPDDKGALRDHSLFHQGRILALLSQSEKAKQMFQKVATFEPRSVLADQAEQRLLALGSKPTDESK